MTWSVAYEQTYVSATSEKHDFWVYFFDTFLNGRGGWTVQAHQTGQSVRRSVTKTMNNTNTGETAAQTWRWNITWSSTSPTTQQVLWYADADYTTAPFDNGLNTDVEVGGIAMVNLTAGDKIKIWASDQDANNWFVTMAGQWQGGWFWGSDYAEYGNLSDIADYNSGSTPSVSYPGCIAGPGFGVSNFAGPPVTDIGNTEGYLLPALGANNDAAWNNSRNPKGGTVIYKNFPMVASSDSSTGLSTSWAMCGGSAPDVGVLVTPLVNAGTRAY